MNTFSQRHTGSQQQTEGCPWRTARFLTLVNRPGFLQDALGVLRVLGTTLDLGYLQHWAGYLKVTELLTKATLAAGLTLPNS
jgi:hypothetical protein